MPFAVLSVVTIAQLRYHEKVQSIDVRLDGL